MQQVTVFEDAKPPSAMYKADRNVLHGVWLNTNLETHGIAKMVIEPEDRELRARTYGAGPNGLVDWGTARVTAVYGSGVDSDAANAFTLRYDFGFMETRLEGNVNRGVLVLAAYNTFKDGSGRLNYFSREYLSVQTTRSEVE